jgi:D-alanine transaminase
MNETVYFNNELVNIEDVWLSPNDRGFIFADGVYEVIKYYNGRPFRYDEHIERLKRSLSEISINYQSLEKLQNIFHELLVINKLDNQHAGIYLQITRGVNKRVHHFPKDISPTVYAFAFELPSNAHTLENGIKVITQQDIRWLRCDIKSVSLLPNTMLYNNAVNKGAGESILIRNGLVSEATHSSVFGVKNGVLFTHPLNNLILPGITRKVVLEICNNNNIAFEEKAISENDYFICTKFQSC